MIARRSFSVFAGLLVSVLTLGSWGVMPQWALSQEDAAVVCGPATPASDDAITASGNGYQVVEFTINDPGTYKLTLAVTGTGTVFTSVQIEAIGDDDQVLAFGITTSEAGEFSSADNIDAGDYYFDVVSSDGEWTLTLELMGGNS